GELTAERRDAFAHPDQAAAVAPTCGRWPRPVVEDIDAEGLGVEAERHRRVLRAGVTQGVRERLLDDPVRGELKRRWQLTLLAHNLELDVEAARPHLPEQRLQPADGRLRRECRLLAARTQDVTEVVARSPGSAADGAHRAPRVGWVGGEDLVRRGRLDDDHAQVVRDHVVHLARDPRLLLGRGATRVRLLLTLELRGTLLDRPQVFAPGA